MLKRLFAGFMVLLLFTAGLYATWVLSPPARNRQLMAAAAERGRAHYAAVQRLAANPRTNGLLEPAFSGYWTEGNPTAAASAIQDWKRDYSGSGIDHAGLLARRDTAYLRARSEVERVVPILAAASRKPAFAVPAPSRGPEALTLPFLPLLYTAEAWAAYAESLAAEGRPDEAVHALLPGLNLAAAVTDHTNCVTDMLGLSVGEKFSEPLFSLVASRSLRTATWKQVATTTAACFPPPEQGVACLEGEIDWARTYLASPSPPSGANPSERFLLSLPGVKEREVRIDHNRVGELYKQTQAAEVPPTPPPASGTLSAWVAGRQTFPSQTALGDDSLKVLALTVQQLALNRRMLAGLYALAALELQRAAHGRYPSQLEEMPPLPRFPWSHFEYHSEGQGFRLLLKLEPSLLALPGRNLHSKGYRWEADGLLFERQISAGPARP